MSNREDFYQVVINHEEQYKIWPVGKELEKGMKSTGKKGTKAECEAYIEEVWKKNKPGSLRG